MKKFIPLVAMAILFLSCDIIFPNDPRWATVKTVTYEVTGTATNADITITNQAGGTDTFANQSIPYTTTITIDGTYHALYLSATNTGTTGDLTTNILIDSVLFKTATGSGDHVKVTTNGISQDQK